MRSDLGDLIRAIGLLKANVNEESRRAIAKALGLDVAWEVTDNTSPEPGGDATDPGQFGDPGTPERSGPPLQTNEIPATLSFLEDAPAEAPPAWLSSTTPLPRRTVEFRSIPPKPSLLTPVWTRALLVGALATVWESGEVDQDALVAQLRRPDPSSGCPWSTWRR